MRILVLGSGLGHRLALALSLAALAGQASVIHDRVESDGFDLRELEAYNCAELPPEFFGWLWRTATAIRSLFCVDDRNRTDKASVWGGHPTLD